MAKSWAALAIVAGLSIATFAGCGRPATAGPRADKQVALDIRAKLKTGGGDASAPGAADAGATGTGWGTLRGTFKYAGTAPTPGKLNVDKDTEVCGKGMGILDNSLVIGSDGGIANIVLFVPKAKRVHESAAPIAKDAKPEPLVFDQKGCMFLTHVGACQVNRPLDIRNSDPIGHNTKIDPQTGAAFNQNLPANQNLAYTLTKQEALPAPVSCSIHPWMKAYMLPRNDKYFAVTKDDGSFEIPNLPAGEEVEIQVWHERGAGPSHALVLPTKDPKWSPKGRFKIKLEPDQTLDLALEVPATALQ
jgi:hypothetical protein